MKSDIFHLQNQEISNNESQRPQTADDESIQIYKEESHYHNA
jgi:hypothetical protein